VCRSFRLPWASRCCWEVRKPGFTSDRFNFFFQQQLSANIILPTIDFEARRHRMGPKKYISFKKPSHAAEAAQPRTDKRLGGASATFRCRPFLASSAGESRLRDQVMGCTFFWFVFFMQVKKMNMKKKRSITRSILFRRNRKSVLILPIGRYAGMIRSAVSKRRPPGFLFFLLNGQGPGFLQIQ
jgi:hypothetical protein